jgi:CubicO group peptidase (beta-lactamase class C family)
MLGYQNNPIAQSKAAQVVFGALGAHGKLPVDLGPVQVGDGLHLLPIERLSYGHPLEVDLDAMQLQTIDNMAQSAITDSMTPGMQILVARKGKVVYHKSFGYMRYEKRDPIVWNHRYDLASLTKIIASLPLAMREQEQDSSFLNRPIASLIRSYDGSNKANVNFKQLFSHHSGIQPWIPFYKETLDSTTQSPRKDLYRSKQRRKHRIQIADKLHLQSSYLDSIESQIIQSPLLDSLYYKYSDLPYYMFKSYIENRHNESIDKQVSSFLIKPMGLYHTSYNPLSKVSKDLIVPSEIDTYYRNQELQGYVHDMGAAMQNGVGGHAGLFSNANDVAKIMQMYLLGGSYGGQQYLQPQTINLFNQRYFANQNNRRGIGFDKQQFEDPGPTCLCASDRSFGHSGFTGTFAWADPDYDLVYVFLSNRTYPTMENTKLVDTNFRSEVQRVIYNALIE